MKKLIFRTRLSHIAYLLLAVVFLSCNHEIHSGKVIYKYYEHERYYTYITYIMVGKTMIPQIHTVYDDEDFIITVKGRNENDIITEDFYVDEKTWKCINVGNLFNDSIPCATDDECK